MTENIVLTIPEEFSYEFLGILALDVLHDAKGRGFLAGHKLYQLTDLLVLSLFEHTPDLSENVRKPLNIWVFKNVLKYFIELWTTNISALGLSTEPDFENTEESYWDFMRDYVILPIRLVADREDEDAFVSLGGTKYGVESQNYHDQKQKLESQHAEILSFISPHAINTPGDYFRQAVGIVDIIKQRTGDKAKSVMDMKSSAGLIRTITDPLGYVTGLPTYADPGYNMPGMSAIRAHSETAFLKKTVMATNEYRGPSEFKYIVKLETPVSDGPLTLLSVHYFYGVGTSGLDRSNMMITIMGETFKGSLPRSTVMAETLGAYLNPTSQPLSVTSGYTLQMLQSLMINCYELMTSKLSLIEKFNELYAKAHKGEKVTKEDLHPIINKCDLQYCLIFSWIYENDAITEKSSIRLAYIFSIIKIFKFYKPINDDFFSNILPNEMIGTLLPELMFQCADVKEDSDELAEKLGTIAFCYHALEILEVYISHENDDVLREKLDKQWLPKRKGKLTTQIKKFVTNWRKLQAAELLAHKTVLHEYVLYVLQVCHANLKKLHALVEVEQDDINIANLTAFLQLIPFLNVPSKIKKVLQDHLFFYHCEIQLRAKETTNLGLLVVALLDTILWKKPLVDFNINFDTELTVEIPPDDPHYSVRDCKITALQTLLGKFSGDFGQIMWSICYGHLFSSEDNNTSAMALLLHRIPKECIITLVPLKVWGNIHGLGDGGCVDIIINKIDRKGRSVLSNLEPPGKMIKRS